MLLDLDMDKDDASKHTRFSGRIKQPAEVSSDMMQAIDSAISSETAAGHKSEPRNSKRRRSSKAKAGAAKRNPRLTALAEVNEEEYGSEYESSDDGSEGAADEGTADEESKQ